MKKKIKNLHSDAHWTPPGYTKKEWREIWQKLWLLSKNDLRNLAKKLGTYFIDKRFQNKTAKKSDFIEIIDDGVNKKTLIKELDKNINMKGLL